MLARQMKSRFERQRAAVVRVTIARNYHALSM